MGKFWIENQLVDEYLKLISGNELKVLFKITRHYNKYGRCFPSIRKMSDKLNMHHTTITKCLERLELLGFLEQLKIKERSKLRYSFAKTARFLFIDSNKLLAKPDTKEDFKEVFKEEKNNRNFNTDQSEHIGMTIDKVRKELEEKGIMHKKQI